MIFILTQWEYYLYFDPEKELEKRQKERPNYSSDEEYLNQIREQARRQN